MRKLFMIVFIVCNTLSVFGQEPDYKNTVFVELGGNGLMASINYERQLFKVTDIMLQAGIGYYGGHTGSITFPVSVNYLRKIGNSKSLLELGMGATYSKADVHLYVIVDYKREHINRDYWNFVPSIGARIITKRNLMYRVRFTPVVNHIGFTPFIGFCFGKRF